MNGIEITHRAPTAKEFIRLREAVGWHVPSPAAAEAALGNSLFSVCVTRDGECIGCGRVVGDGSLVFHVQDVMVQPEHQRCGHGSRLMEALMEYINVHARPTAFIALFATPGLEPWYERHGFVRRPMDDRGPGMAQFKK